MRYLLTLLFLCGSFPALSQPFDNIVEHDLQVRLDPQQHTLAVEDKISLPANSSSEYIFTLHKGLSPTIADHNIQLTELTTSKNSLHQTYKLELPHHQKKFTLLYAGKINHPLESYGKEQARGYKNTPGLISTEGVYLAAGSYWFAQFENFPYLRFNMQIELPSGWKTISQGERNQQSEVKGGTVEQWDSSSPQEEIYLIAAPFNEYHLKTGSINALVFLRQPDEKLANKYLQATSKYIDMYEQLLGPYPYSKFALVENFWETGFGMPSFTLLGSTVIRLPFIINSSYPHEILHNWWGNGVYVDFASGNWSEGLTAYLADHLIKQQQGQATNYRLQSLQKYNDYAAKSRDFPLSQFRGRHSTASEAVGYGKTLMLFNMLRQQLGDVLFIKSLQHFYRQYQFKIATFDDLRKSFEVISGQSLELFFSQWIKRTGAVDLQLGHSLVQQQDNLYHLDFELTQEQSGAAYQLQIPVAVTLEGKRMAHQQIIKMSQKNQRYQLHFDSRPLRIDIDPEFDLFRKLAIAETPPAFTRLFGAQKMMVILPRSAKPGLQTGWQNFAEDLTRMGPENISIVWDDEINSLPKNQAVTVLGWSNRFATDIISALSNYNVKMTHDSLKIKATHLPRRHHSIAVTSRYQQNGHFPRSFIATDRSEALPGLGRKLPHYHKYSYLAFTGDEPQIKLKGRWPVKQSPMTRLFDHNAKRAELKKRAALTEAKSIFDADKMLQSIQFLTDESLQGRGFGKAGLNKAADYIASAFQQAGLQSAGDEPGSYFQHWSEKGGEPEQTTRLKNIIAVIPGHHPTLSNENVVIGAHYDHLGLGWPDVREGNEGRIHTGADDNASGVAVLLELARVLNSRIKPDRNIVFVAFSGEEAGRKGSRHYLRHHQQFPPEKTIGMLNLDTVGRLGENNVLVLGGDSASEWPHIFRGTGFVTGIPITMVSENLDTSDQISFHEAGIPAVQLFSGANQDYHRPTDTADKIDPAGLVKIATVSRQVIEYLAVREDPLTHHLSPAQSPQPVKSGKLRKVSLGSIPDFSYQGDGYRLSGVTAQSPAELAGLQKGDIIINLNGSEIHGLRDISTTLKSMRAGQSVSIIYKRKSKVIHTQATLKIK